MSVSRVEINRKNTKPKVMKLTFFTADFAPNTELFLDVIKYPDIQHPEIIKTQSFGELNGSSSEGLKYIVIKNVATNNPVIGFAPILKSVRCLFAGIVKLYLNA